MYRFLSYLKFLVSSTNEHGIHSPFVYNFVTKGLYRRKKIFKSISEDALHAAICYFNCKRIGIVNTDDYIKERLSSLFDDVEFNNYPKDVIYVKAETCPTEIFTKGNYHNNTLIVFNGMHDSREKSTMWREIKALPEVRVTIDLFHCGMVFFRREQAKEHFKIRL